MLLRTHLVFSIFLYLLMFNFFEEKFIFLLFLILGTVVVDIDTSKSKLGKKWFFRPLQWFTKHRGIFHTLFFSLLFSVLIFYFNKSAGTGFFAGYVLHLFLDCFTKSGVKLFYPLSDLKIRLIGIRSGGLIEEILFVLLLLGNVFLFLRLLSIGYF